VGDEVFDFSSQPADKHIQFEDGPFKLS